MYVHIYYNTTKFLNTYMYTGNFGGGKFWQTIQVKATGKEKFGKLAI